MRRRAVDQRLEHSCLHGLYDIRRAKVLGFVPQHNVIESRKYNYPRLRVHVLREDGELEPVERAKSDVGQQDVERLLPKATARVFEGSAGNDLLSRTFRERLLEDVQHALVIVYNQDLERLVGCAICIGHLS